MTSVSVSEENGVAVTLEVGAQLLVVLDDAVVDDGEPVTRDMRMRVALARHAVRGPAGVGDADLAGGGGVFERIIQHAHLADRAQPGEVLRAVQHRDAGGIVAAVLEPPQTLHQDRYDVALGDRSDDSAHGSLPSVRGPFPQGPGDRQVCLNRAEKADLRVKSRDRGRAYGPRACAAAAIFLFRLQRTLPACERSPVVRGRW